MACMLGLCRLDDYRATIADRDGQTVMELDFVRLDWQRVLDAVSVAHVVVPPNCCGKLKDVWPWRHELHISRAGEQVWEGPIMVQANCRSGIVIEARDVLQWGQRRVIHNDHCWDPACLGNPIGSVQAAEALIRDGYAPDDPRVLPHLTVVAGAIGVVSGRVYKANSKYVLTALHDLAKGSLDFTVVGRRIILMEEGQSIGRTSLLTCEHFGGDICTTTDGYATATRAVVTGDKDTGVMGSFGGVDPYFGLIEVLQEDEQITSSATATDQARGIVNGANPPPLLVQPPEDNGMSPEAPVCMKDLVPGVTVPVAMACTCRTAGQDMRLSKLNVKVDATGETVAPLLTPVGTL